MWHLKDLFLKHFLSPAVTFIAQNQMDCGNLLSEHLCFISQFGSPYPVIGCPVNLTQQVWQSSRAAKEYHPPLKDGLRDKKKKKKLFHICIPTQSLSYATFLSDYKYMVRFNTRTKQSFYFLPLNKQVQAVKINRTRYTDHQKIILQ